MLTKILQGKTALLGVALLAYAIYLLSQGAQLSPVESMSYVGYGIAILIAVFMIMMIAKPSTVPTGRRKLAAVGLMLIFLSRGSLLDDPTQYVFMRDLLILVGVFFVVVGPLKLLITKEQEDKIQEAEAEIIEV